VILTKQALSEGLTQETNNISLFEELPQAFVMTVQNLTTLQAEILLNSSGQLEMQKSDFLMVGKEKVFVISKSSNRKRLQGTWC